MQQPARQEAQQGSNERWQCGERQRCRGAGGGGMTRGDMTNSCGGQEVSALEKKRGTTRGSGATRSEQVEALPDGRQWRDKKLRQQRTKGNITTS
jgi:hypothetical protein